MEYQIRKKPKTFWVFQYWKRHQFKILVFSSIFFMMYLSVFQPTEGTYTKEFLTHLRHTPLFLYNDRRIPKESKGEVECRRVLEKFFNKPFSKDRPSFLLNNVTGKPLEIDCCNHELKIGVEYNGKQHYTYTPSFHKSFEKFQAQRYRDEMKEILCKQNGFTLIQVPYTIEVDQIEDYIRKELKKVDISIPRNFTPL